MKGLFYVLLLLLHYYFGQLIWSSLGKNYAIGAKPLHCDQNRGSLIVGTINNPIYYFIGNEGESGLEYELAKNFADYLGVRLQIKTLENNDQLFNELENNNIDIAAANLLFQPQRAEKFQLGPLILLPLGSLCIKR